MSHQTGIRANDELKEFFASCKSGHIRLFKVAIENEKLILASQRSPQGTFEEDYDRLVKPLLEEKQPCYIFVRMDSMNQSGHDWLFISYSPDLAHVKQKMLYASTKASLKQEFGASQIKDELFGTTSEDVSFRGYQKHVNSRLAPKPYSMQEEELMTIKMQERHIGVDARHPTMTGVAFPISDDAMAKVFDIRDGQINYAQFSIDIKKEMINLETSGTIEVEKLANKVPKDQARYHLFVFRHSYQGCPTDSLVFIYSMPGYKCSIKERMLYSSCKGPFVDMIESKLGMTIAKKIEVDSGDDLTEEYFVSELHPPAATHHPGANNSPVQGPMPPPLVQQFSRPKPPATRGGRRINK